MYGLINENLVAILDYIADDHDDYVNRYVWLIKNTNVQRILDLDYRRCYRKFWAMRTNTAYDEDVYFPTLQDALNTGNLPNLADIKLRLYATKLQFSFATKLVHMIDHKKPIYDSRIAAFYLFGEPVKRDSETPQKFRSRKLENLMSFYAFLQNEYSRVRRQRLLENAISGFRQRFPKATNKHFSNVKVIDALIWGFVGWVSSNRPPIYR